MLLRRAAILTFAIAASLVVACGHQVTPSPSYSDLAGDVVLRFRVNGTLDFTNYTYAVVIDTCGNGTPYPQAYATTFNSYSYAFFVGATFGVGSPQLYEYFVSPNSSGTIIPALVQTGPSFVQFVPNDNGQGNEFELIFPRLLLANPLGQPKPCPNLPAVTRSPAPLASAGATPTAAATLAAGASPSPVPSLTPNPYPTVAAQEFWSFNYYTIQNASNGSNGTILDSLGIGGPTDNTFNSAVLDTDQTYDVPFFKATGGTTPGNPNAQLSGGDIQNYQ